MIEGIVGLPGAGKTLFGVHLLLRDLSEGRKIFANFTSRRGLWERVAWDRVRNMGDASVLIDEAHMWFPSRGGLNETSKYELAVFQQHRKAGVNLYWTAQHEARIDVALRELTAYVYQCRRVGPFILWSRFEGLKSAAILKRGVIRIDRYGREYFTEERVLARNEVSGDPIVGVRPNWARYVDLEGRVRWRRRDSGMFGGSGEYGPESVWYKSPYGGEPFLWERNPR